METLVQTGDFARVYLVEIIIGISTNTILLLVLHKFLQGRGLLTGILLQGILLFLVYYLGGSWVEYTCFLLIPTLILCLIFIPGESSKEKENRNSYKVVELQTHHKQKIYIKDLNRGVAIFGSSGAGKTESVIYYLLKHMAKHQFAGILYDYKDYELTELAYPLFKKNGVPLNIFALHDVNRSVRINVLDPAFIQSESDVNGLISTLILNLAESDSLGTEKFFRDGMESLMAGVTWRLKKDYPDKCNLPFIIAFLLSAENQHGETRLADGTLLVKPYQKLVDFICQDQRAEILASVFLTGINNERQTASLYSTLANHLRKLASPEIFYLLEKTDISLDLNADTNRSVLSFVNQPGTKESVFSPIYAMTIEACFSQMSKRHRKPSFCLLDEAPTITLMSLGRKIATLRSYLVSFIYCMQDKVQGVSQFHGKEYKIKEILTNLSTQFMGKVNDADTAKYYEGFFEIIEKKQKSISSPEGGFILPADKGGTRITTSTKEQSKRRAYEFFQLKQGEFIMFSDGKDRRFRFYHELPEHQLPLPFRDITPTELEENYTRILHEAKNFFNILN